MSRCANKRKKGRFSGTVSFYDVARCPNVAYVLWNHITFHRVQAYIKHGWSSKVIDPDGRTRDSITVRAQSSSQLIPSNENCNWQPLKEAFTGNTTNQTLSFCNAQLINYFVLRSTVDGMPANDMKAIDSSALNLFLCGHV